MPTLDRRTLDILVALALAWLHTSSARLLGRKLLLAGESESVFYGLDIRREKDVDGLLIGYLQDSEAAVNEAALRVTGLLRRTELLDWYEQASSPIKDPRLRKALDEARVLVQLD